MITGVQDSALHTENIEERNIVEEKEKQLQAALHYLRNTPHQRRTTVISNATIEHHYRPISFGQWLARFCYVGLDGQTHHARVCLCLDRITGIVKAQEGK